MRLLLPLAPLERDDAAGVTAVPDNGRAAVERLPARDAAADTGAGPGFCNVTELAFRCPLAPLRHWQNGHAAVAAAGLQATLEGVQDGLPHLPLAGTVVIAVIAHQAAKSLMAAFACATVRAGWPSPSHVLPRGWSSTRRAATWRAVARAASRPGKRSSRGGHGGRQAGAVDALGLVIGGQFTVALAAVGVLGGPAVRMVPALGVKGPAAWFGLRQA